jgi:hypothetical protein
MILLLMYILHSAEFCGMILPFQKYEETVVCSKTCYFNPKKLFFLFFLFFQDIIFPILWR